MKSAMNGDDRPATGADNARRSVRICAYEGKDLSWRDDTVAVERALEIHIAGVKPLITMCTRAPTPNWWPDSCTVMA